MCPTCHTTLDMSELAGRAADRRVHLEEDRRMLDGAADRESRSSRTTARRSWRLRRTRGSICSPGGCRSPASSAARSCSRSASGAGAAARARGAGRARGLRARRGDRASPRRPAGTLRLMGTRLGISFAAGFVSVDHAVRAAARAGLPRRRSRASKPAGSASAGTTRRVVVSSLPFIFGFTVVFVVLGAGAAAIGSVRLGERRRHEIAGFVLVVLGLAFVGLLPVPERVLAPGLLWRRAAPRLGRAARRCVRGVRGAVHRDACSAAVLVLASNSGTV